MVSRSGTVAATIWLALTNVGCGAPSWLIEVPTALARARALVRSIMLGRSISSVYL
jgi:hypothetical protein